MEEIRLSQVSKNGRKLFACAAPWDDADPFYVQVNEIAESVLIKLGLFHCFVRIIFFSAVLSKSQGSILLLNFRLVV